MKCKMKSILISTRPKWCEKICHEIGKDEMGKPIYEKRIEVRKSAPKEVPFKAYIYCSKDNANEIVLLKNYKNRFIFGDYRNADGHFYTIANGKVIGEFICDKVERFTVGSLRSDDIEKLACLSYNEMINYFYKPEELDGKTVKQGFAWHISDLKIYDKPKELNEFFNPCPTKEKGDCLSCDCLADNDYGGVCTNNLTRPPQSWQYVEESENE